MDEIIIDKGCGLDVHKETVVACVMGSGIKKDIRTFSTMTNDLLRLKTWLSGLGITHVAMESTGPYWKPVFNVLEDGFTLILANARYIKNVPGRKTDVKDSEWICRLLRSGLLSASFVPPQGIRELRDLTRYRRKLTQAVSGEESHSEGAGGCECKDIVSVVRHIRCERQPDDRGDHGGQAQRSGDSGFSER